MGSMYSGLIGAAVGATGGIISGARGTPDQLQYQDTTSSMELGDRSIKQRNMEQYSYNQYLKQLEAANLSQKIATESDPLRQAALAQQLGLLTGEAFAGPNEQEQAQIDALRQSMVTQGSQDINKMLDERMRQTVSGAAGRGLRGQALGELQGRVIDAGSEELGRLVNQANLTAAQNAISLPQQRLAMQNQAANQAQAYTNMLAQQALQNRTITQNPYLMQQLQNERLATATQKQGTVNRTPGAKGGFWNAVTGGLGGSMAGWQIGSGGGGMDMGSMGESGQGTAGSGFFGGGGSSSSGLGSGMGGGYGGFSGGGMSA